MIVKTFSFSSLHDIKMEQKALIFGKEGIIKNLFHKSKRTISINKVDNKKQFCLKKN